MAINIDADNADGVSRAAVNKPFPRLTVSIFWIFVFFLLQIIAPILAIASTILGSSNAEEVIKNPEIMMQDMSTIAMPMIWGLVVSNLLTLGMLMVYLVQKNRLNLIHFNNWSKLSFGRTVGICVALVGAALIFNFVYATYIVPGVELQAGLKQFFAAIPDTVGNSILLFVMIAILAPLLEEFLFRGLLQNSLKNLLPTHAAIWLSGIIFGAIHFDLYALPALAALGVAFGYLYEKTGSLRTCIILHMINNAAALMLPKIAVWLELSQ